VGAIPGWPLRPFHEQHPLRSGFDEKRDSSFHHGIDIQARDGQAVYAIQPGRAQILQATGADSRVQVGNFIYWHVVPAVAGGQFVAPYSTVVGHVMAHFGHLHLSEVDAAGAYVNPLRPGGRVLTPYVDTARPVIGPLHLSPDGRAWIATFDPQSFVRTTTYRTPVIAPAAIAWRLERADGRPLGDWQWAYRGTTNLPWSDAPLVWTPQAHKAPFTCFEHHRICRPDWRFVLAGGFTPRIVAPASGRYALAVLVYDWAQNASRRTFPLRAAGGRLSLDRSGGGG
jgi:hypothetical protein